MYPLKSFHKVRRTLRFKTPYPAGFGALSGKPHLGIDYVVPVGTPIYAFDKKVKVIRAFKGSQGGNTIWVENDGHIVRFLHLRELPKVGTYKRGDIIAYTGNTGLSTAPHTHVDVSKGSVQLANMKNFIDPDVYFEKIHNAYLKEQADEEKAEKKKEEAKKKPQNDTNTVTSTDLKPTSNTNVPLPPENLPVAPISKPSATLETKPEQKKLGVVESVLFWLFEGFDKLRKK